MSSILIYALIMLVSLSLGAIGVGAYIANFRSKPQNKNKSFSVATVTLIMVSSFLVGLLVSGIYYGVTYKPTPLTCEEVRKQLGTSCDPVCPKCVWGPADAAKFRAAQEAIDILKVKADSIPRNLRIKAQCDAAVNGVCTSGNCCGVESSNISNPPGRSRGARGTTPYKFEDLREMFPTPPVAGGAAKGAEPKK